MSDFNIYCISARRPSNVPAMAAYHPDLIWVVPADEVGEYEAMGAAYTLGVSTPDGNSLVAQRNMAIEHAQAEGVWCVQTDDDLKSLHWWDGEHKVSMTLTQAAHLMLGNDPMCHLIGGSPTNNTYFFRKDYSYTNFIIAQLIAVSPTTPLRFDPNLLVKEDYDYVLQHLAAYGKALRINRLMPDYRHYSNRGGVVSYRTPDVEQKAIAYLKDKWGNHVQENKRRPNEVLLRWKG